MSILETCYSNKRTKNIPIYMVVILVNKFFPFISTKYSFDNFKTYFKEIHIITYCKLPKYYETNILHIHLKCKLVLSIPKIFHCDKDR